MSIILIPTDALSSKTDAGLDVLRRIFSCDSSREVALAVMPARYVADSVIDYNGVYACDPVIGTTYNGMFLMDINVRETGIKLCEVEMIFNGSFFGDLPAGKHDNGNSYGNGQAQVPSVGTVSLGYLAPVRSFTWLSTQEGVGGTLVTPLTSGAWSSIYTITGTLHFSSGSNIVTGSGTSFISEVQAGDRIYIPTQDPDTIAGFVGFVGLVASTPTSNTSLTVTAPASTGGTGYAVDTARGIHLASIAVSVVSIRLPATFSTLLTGVVAASLGPTLVALYFVPLVVPTIESKELVPGRYWQNTQRNTTTLLPVFA